MLRTEWLQSHQRDCAIFRALSLPRGQPAPSAILPQSRHGSPWPRAIRIRQDASVTTAEPAIAVARDQVIDRIADHPWDEVEDPCPLPARKFAPTPPRIIKSPWLTSAPIFPPKRKGHRRSQSFRRLNLPPEARGRVCTRRETPCGVRSSGKRWPCRASRLRYRWREGFCPRQAGRRSIWRPESYNPRAGRALGWSSVMSANTAHQPPFRRKRRRRVRAKRSNGEAAAEPYPLFAPAL